MIAERFIREAGGLTDGSRKTNGRREPVAMLGVAPLRIGQGVSGPRAGFPRGFWTSKGIFAQRWGLNVGFNGSSFERSKALAARRRCGLLKAKRDKDLKRMG